MEARHSPWKSKKASSGNRGLHGDVEPGTDTDQKQFFRPGSRGSGAFVLDPQSSQPHQTAAIHSQLKGVHSGLRQLHNALGDVKDIQNSLVEVSNDWRQSSNTIENLKYRLTQAMQPQATTPIPQALSFVDFCNPNRFFLTSFGALYISDVQKEDALSTYRCITKHKYSGETRQSNGARLSVMDPTESSPSILDSFQAGEVRAGLSVELPCIAAGYPSPTVRWLKDGRPLPSDAHWTRRLTGLTISDLRQEDSGSYACEVTNSFGSKEVSGALYVIGAPPPSITWTLDDEPVVRDSAYKTSQYTLSDGLTVSHVNVSSPAIRDGGVYRCAARNSAGSAEYQARINPPSTSIRRRLSNVTVQVWTDNGVAGTRVGAKVDRNNR
ncbi:cell adhesion molecule DSCAML1-like [Salvelinus sp. IW2-2015]|uniref:cell adhesion molecule DSCAML1-like n=1 Tax=Salvelinus sp. IW2-2015 TaxID=2691554 RepID=UPI0038D3D9EB